MRLSIILLAGVLIGCAAVKIPEPTGGSRADGTVELSYEVAMFEEPQVQWATADASALERCRNWGYSGAEKFSAGKSTCQAFNGYGNCVRKLVTIQYQCTGDPEQDTKPTRRKN